MQISHYLIILLPAIFVVSLPTPTEVPCIPKFMIPGAPDIDDKYRLIPLGPGMKYCDGSTYTVNLGTGGGGKSSGRKSGGKSGGISTPPPVQTTPPTSKFTPPPRVQLPIQSSVQPSFQPLAQPSLQPSLQPSIQPQVTPTQVPQSSAPPAAQSSSSPASVNIQHSAEFLAQPDDDGEDCEEETVR